MEIELRKRLEKCDALLRRNGVHSAREEDMQGLLLLVRHIEALRNDELETAIDEFTDAFLSFLEHYEENENAYALHPFYGQLNYAQWQRLHTKHFAHHFEQFGLL